MILDLNFFNIKIFYRFVWQIFLWQFDWILWQGKVILMSTPHTLPHDIYDLIFLCLKNTFNLEKYVIFKY